MVGLIRNKWIQSGVAGIPFAGGAIQSFMSNVIQEIDQRKWECYWEGLESRLLLVEKNKVNLEYFESEDFIRRLRRVYKEVVSGADSVKIDYLRNYIIASAFILEFDSTWKDLALRHLENITGSHILVLKFFFDTQKKLSFKDRFELHQRTENSPVVLDKVVKALDCGDDTLVEMIISDLCASGLLASWHGGSSSSKGWSVTDSGLRLMNFLILPKFD